MSGRCEVVCVEVSKTGPVSFRQCRSGGRDFFEVAWNNVERWLFLDRAEAGAHYKSLIAKYLENSKFRKKSAPRAARKSLLLNSGGRS